MSDSSAPDGDGKSFPGTFSDGTSALAERVIVRPERRGLRIVPDSGHAPPRFWEWADLRANGPLREGQPPLLAHAHQPDARLFIDNPDIVPLLLRRVPHLSARHHRRRLLLPMLLVSSLLIGLTAWLWSSEFSLARMVAHALPRSLHAALGRAIAHSMTGGKICADPAGRQALRKMTARLAPDLPAAARDRVMVARIGMVNAFTTPGGYIIIGKELVDFARSPDEVAAVLAHEMGHAELEHPEAALVRTAGISLVIHMIFGGGTLGDVSGLLVQLSFSRQAERQADAIAIRRMRRAGADPAALASFFERLEGKYGHGKAGGLLNLLQTHPPTAERIRTMRQASLPRARAILDAGDWRALRHICDRTAPLASADE